MKLKFILITWVICLAHINTLKTFNRANQINSLKIYKGKTFIQSYEGNMSLELNSKFGILVKLFSDYRKQESDELKRLKNSSKIILQKSLSISKNERLKSGTFSLVNSTPTLVRSVTHRNSLAPTNPLSDEINLADDLKSIIDLLEPKHHKKYESINIDYPKIKNALIILLLMKMLLFFYYFHILTKVHILLLLALIRVSAYTILKCLGIEC
jgi:hypothetical protein